MLNFPAEGLDTEVNHPNAICFRPLKNLLLNYLQLLLLSPLAVWIYHWVYSLHTFLLDRSSNTPWSLDAYYSILLKNGKLKLINIVTDKPTAFETVMVKYDFAVILLQLCDNPWTFEVAWVAWVCKPDISKELL